MNIGVLGIGAIGTIVSLELKDNNRIYYYNRTQKSNLKLQFQDTLFKKNILLNSSDNAITLDWLIICLKEYHYKNISNLLKKLISKNTKVAVIRNGINLKDYILPYTDNKNIIECIIDCPVQQENENYYTQLKKGVITLDKKASLFDFDTLFKKRNLEFHFSKDFKTDSWKKLIESSAIGGILCLSGKTAEIFNDAQIVELYIKIVKEGIEVANRENAKITPEFISFLIKRIQNLPPNKGSSMLTDRLNGNLIEIYAKNGVISSLSRKHGVSTPINDLITHLSKHINT